MTLLVKPTSGLPYLVATVLDRGPSGFDWIKAQLPNGDECFVYPDTDKTIPVKEITPGVGIAVANPRPCKTKGTTKHTTNALHINLQPQEVKDLIASMTSQPDVDQYNGYQQLTKESKKSLTVRYSKMRHAYAEEIARKYGFSGRSGLTEALGHIVDTCMYAGLL
jgi:hypothetical protein